MKDHSENRTENRTNNCKNQKQLCHHHANWHC